MTLQVQPRKLATLEPVKAALRQALVDELAEALEYVEDLMEAGDLPAVTLEPPKEIRTATVRSYTQVKVWPTVTVETSQLSARMNSQGVAIGALTGTVRIICWLRSGRAEDMDAMLDRYATAVWLVLKQRDSLGGATVAPEQPTVLPDETGGTGNQRAVEILFDVVLRV